MSLRAFDTHQRRESFNTEVMVRCPRCESLALSRTIDREARDWFAQRRVTCTGCSYTKVWQGRVICRAGADAVDDYFSLPLFLQVRCAEGVLWAYNTEHLRYLQLWLEAPLRARRRDPQHGWSNGSLPSRLPRWIKSAKNRPAMSAALRKLDSLAATVTRR